MFQVDHFREEIVVRKKKGLFNLALALVTLAMLGSALLAVGYLYRIQSTLMTSSFSFVNVLLLLLFGGILAGLFYVRVHMRVEYEYSFTNGELDVDRVLNNTKRETLCTIRMSQVERMAAVEHPDYSTFDQEKNLKRIYAVLNRYSQTYFLVYNTGEERKMLLFEPSEELVAMMRLYHAKEIIPAEQAGV